LVAEWDILELRVFYGYLFACIAFLFVCHCGFQPNKKYKTDDLYLGGQVRDFIETNSLANHRFSMLTFELITCLIIMIEFISAKTRVERATSDSYSFAMYIIIAYGLATSFQTFEIFEADLTEKAKRSRKQLYFGLHIFRSLCIAVVIYFLFTLEGREIMFGFWLITSVCFFVIESFYTYFRYRYFQGLGFKRSKRLTI
jgi:hypothetical protein